MWNHCISRHGPTNLTPFELVYVEVNLDAYQLGKPNDLSTVIYHVLMMDNVNKVIDNKIIKALKEIEKDSLSCQGLQ